MKSRHLSDAVRILGSASIMLAVLLSCGDERTADADETEMAQTSTTSSDVVARADFVLCPAIEEIADQLAERVGFERDPERSVAGVGSECFVRSVNVGWIRVALPPAIIRTVAMQAGGYEGESTLAPVLGENAVFIDAQLQPHVIFELLGQIIDVGVEGTGYDAPDRATVIEVATMVRDALQAANGG